MTVVMEIEKPEDVRLTLHCTMTVSQWRYLVDQIPPQRFESDIWVFVDAIKIALERAEVKVNNQAVLT